MIFYIRAKLIARDGAVMYEKIQAPPSPSFRKPLPPPMNRMTVNMPEDCYFPVREYQFIRYGKDDIGLPMAIYEEVG